MAKRQCLATIRQQGEQGQHVPYNARDCVDVEEGIGESSHAPELCSPKPPEDVSCRL